MTRVWLAILLAVAVASARPATKRKKHARHPQRPTAALVKKKAKASRAVPLPTATASTAQTFLVAPGDSTALSGGPSAAAAQDAAADRTAVASPTSEVVALLERHAAPYLGTRYRFGGRGDRGFDCSGFVLTVLGDLGIQVQGRSSRDLAKLGEPVDRADLRPGDLVFFARHRGRVSHIGIYLDQGLFVHSSVGEGVIRSKIDEHWYGKYYWGARRVSEIEQGIALALANPAPALAASVPATSDSVVAVRIPPPADAGIWLW